MRAHRAGAGKPGNLPGSDACDRGASRSGGSARALRRQMCSSAAPPNVTPMTPTPNTPHLSHVRRVSRAMAASAIDVCNAGRLRPAVMQVHLAVGLRIPILDLLRLFGGM